MGFPQALDALGCVRVRGLGCASCFLRPCYCDPRFSHYCMLLVARGCLVKPNARGMCLQLIERVE